MPNGASFSRNRSADAISAACLTASGTAGQPKTAVTWMRSWCDQGHTTGMNFGPMMENPV